MTQTEVYEQIFNDFRECQALGKSFKARDFIEQQVGKDREELVTLIEVFCTRQPHIKTIDDVAQELVNFLTIVKILDLAKEEEITTLRLKFLDIDVDLNWGDDDIPNTVNSG